jgi:phosphoesterase RecJ-like protein
MTIDWTPLHDAVRRHQRFLLTSHVRPDCDALGSELAMAHILQGLGKEVWIVNGDPTPANLTFLDPDRRILVIDRDIQMADLESVEVLIVLDTSAWVQLGPMASVVRRLSATKLVIDHHVDGDDLGATVLKNARAEAAGRLVAEAAEQLGVALTPEMATPLFAALSTDTGWFRFPSASSETYRLAARLIDAGASPSALYGALYEQDTAGGLRLQGLITSRLVTELGGRLVHMRALQRDFQAVGALPSDTEDVINLGLAIAGTEVAVMGVEQPDGGCKFSFRSRGELDCSQLAAQFGGGGHKAAAGAAIAEPIDQAYAKVLDAVRAAMR